MFVYVCIYNKYNIYILFNYITVLYYTFIYNCIEIAVQPHGKQPSVTQQAEIRKVFIKSPWEHSSSVAIRSHPGLFALFKAIQPKWQDSSHSTGPAITSKCLLLPPAWASKRGRNAQNITKHHKVGYSCDQLCPFNTAFAHFPTKTRYTKWVLGVYAPY